MITGACQQVFLGISTVVETGLKGYYSIPNGLWSCQLKKNPGENYTVSWNANDGCVLLNMVVRTQWWLWVTVQWEPHAQINSKLYENNEEKSKMGKPKKKKRDYYSCGR